MVYSSPNAPSDRNSASCIIHKSFTWAGFAAQCPWRCSYHTVTQWTQTWGHGCLICHTRLDCKMAGFKALHDLKTNCTHSASTVSGKAKEWESHLVVSRGICVQNTYLHPQCGAQPTFVVVPHPSYCIQDWCAIPFHSAKTNGEFIPCIWLVGSEWRKCQPQITNPNFVI